MAFLPFLASSWFDKCVLILNKNMKITIMTKSPLFLIPNKNMKITIMMKSLLLFSLFRCQRSHSFKTKLHAYCCCCCSVLMNITGFEGFSLFLIISPTKQVLIVFHCYCTFSLLLPSWALNGPLLINGSWKWTISIWALNISIAYDRYKWKWMTSLWALHIFIIEPYWIFTPEN